MVTNQPANIRCFVLWFLLMTGSGGLASAALPLPLPTPPPASPQERLQRAHDRRVHGDYAAAAAEYEALRVNADIRLDAVLGQVDCQLAVGQYADAAELLSAESERGRSSAAFALVAARWARCVGEYDQAMVEARAALQRDPRQAAARLLLCQVLERVGRRDEAIAEYEWFERLVLRQLPIKADDLTAVGEGFYRYSVLTRDANLADRTRHVLTQIFQVACERIDKDYWPARIASAELLREKYNLREAGEEYRAALEINSNAVDAHVGLGWLAVEDWEFEEIDRRVALALDINTNHVAALNLRAAGKLIERDYDAAAASADRALAVNPRDIEALGLKAAALLAQSKPDEAQAQVTRGEAVNPCSGVLYQVIADTLGGLRRFDEAEARYRQAIACAPTASAPRIELGMMYMQSGEEAKARDVLEGAWKLDPFNDRTKNTLDLLDRLDRFAEIAGDGFVIRYDAEHDEIVARYFAEHLARIFTEVCAKFDAKLARPAIIEIFPSHTEFGVRIHGKPWIHTIGACTGWVIAMDAPRRGGDLPGPYNFAEVLCHEFTHTVTLAITNFRIPHWFTEGLAVHTEGTERPYDWTAQLADAVRRGELYSLASIDWGFVRPKKADGRQQAYAQSEWMCEYLIATYGPEVIQRMLALFALGQSQPQVFLAVTGDAPERFDGLFAAWAREQAQAWGFDLTPPEDVEALREQAERSAGDAEVLARLARAEYDAHDWEKAKAAAERSLNADENQPLALSIFIRACQHQLAEPIAPPAQQALEDEVLAAAGRLLAVDPRNRFALAGAGYIHAKRGQADEAIPLLRTLHEVWPLDPEPARTLAGIHYERGEYAEALPYFVAAAPRQTHDASLPQRIGDIHERASRLAEARLAYRQTLSIDPLSEEAHLRLAEIAMRMNDLPAAIEAYRLLCRIAPDSAAYHSGCALAYHKLGDRASMRTYAERAVKLDPNSPAGALLRE